MLYSSLSQQYLELACQNLPVIKRILECYGSLTLAEYAQQLVTAPIPSYQPREDLFDVVYQYIAPLLGENIAQRTIHDLSTNPIVLTTNHHGVEYFSQTFQARLIFSLNAITGVTTQSTIPIFACGNVPLNNPTYPRGLLLYSDPEWNMKLPLFPNRLRKSMVSVVPSLDQTLLRKFQALIDKMAHNEKIHLSSDIVLRKILQEDYQNESVIALSSYSQQAVVLNNRIWKRLFSGFASIPEMVYLEQEKIAAELLKFDLTNPKSLIWQIMFDPMLRNAVLTELNGKKGCWNLENLMQRLRTKNPVEGCGTVFFWGIDQDGRRIPLSVENDLLTNELILRGIDDHGSFLEIPYTPDNILYNLHENKLLASGFTFFLITALARGLVCIGGYFQCEYLPQIKEGVVKVLYQKSSYEHIARLVAHVPANFYLDGMSAVMTRTQSGYLIPCGPIEIIASGGINRRDIEQILSQTVRETHLADISDIALDAIPHKFRQPGWKTQLAYDCSQLLEGKIVIK